MKYHNFFLIVLLVTFLGLISFDMPSNIKKKVTKEIKSTFDIETFILNEISVPKEVNTKLKAKIHKDNFFKITYDDKLLGYAFVDKAPSKTDEFDYLVLFDQNLILKKAKILVYREDYGGEIGSKRWLKQFIGKESKDKLTYEKDIVAISGATISANSMTVAVNNLLQSIGTLQENKAI